MFKSRLSVALQWRRWLADSGLPQGFGSYLAWRVLPSPSPPFPSLHPAMAVQTRPECRVWQHGSRMGRGPREWCDASGGAAPGTLGTGAGGARWRGMNTGVSHFRIFGRGAGGASRRDVHPDIRTLALELHFFGTKAVRTVYYKPSNLDKGI
jgi:hypothetical protein